VVDGWDGGGFGMVGKLLVPRVLLLLFMFEMREDSTNEMVFVAFFASAVCKFGNVVVSDENVVFAQSQPGE
jgi:hypothetical protein